MPSHGPVVPRVSPFAGWTMVPWLGRRERGIREFSQNIFHGCEPCAHGLSAEKLARYLQLFFWSAPPNRHPHRQGCRIGSAWPALRSISTLNAHLSPLDREPGRLSGSPQESDKTRRAVCDNVYGKHGGHFNKHAIGLLLHLLMRGSRLQASRT